MTELTPFISRELTTPDYGPRPSRSIGENIRAGFDQGLAGTSEGLASRYRATNRTGTAMTPEEFRSSFYGQAGIEYQPGMTWQQAQAILDAHVRAQRYA